MQYDPTFPMIILNHFLWIMGYIVIPFATIVSWFAAVSFWKDNWYQYRTKTKSMIWLGNVFGFAFAVFLTGFFIKI